MIGVFISEVCTLSRVLENSIPVASIKNIDLKFIFWVNRERLELDYLTYFIVLRLELTEFNNCPAPKIQDKNFEKEFNVLIHIFFSRNILLEHI